jgi:hypothetical protein
MLGKHCLFQYLLLFLEPPSSFSISMENIQINGMFLEVLQKIRRIKSLHGGLPTEADLQRAGGILIRLMDTYGLDVDQLIAGDQGELQNYRHQGVIC